MQQAAPYIPFQQDFMLGDEVWTATPGAPRGKPPTVRSTQVLLLMHEGEVKSIVMYSQLPVVQQVRLQSAEDVDDTVYGVLMAWKAVVDGVIPYDVHNLVYDLGGVDVAAKMLNMDVSTMCMYLAHTREWSVDRLVLLKRLYPQLDLEATLMRHSLVRQMSGLGIWRNVQQLSVRSTERTLEPPTQ